jgi:hypothetical protein
VMVAPPDQRIIEALCATFRVFQKMRWKLSCRPKESSLASHFGTNLHAQSVVVAHLQTAR